MDYGFGTGRQWPDETPEPRPTDTGPAGPFSRYEVAMPARALPVARRTTGARA